MIKNRMCFYKHDKKNKEYELFFAEVLNNKYDKNNFTLWRF